MVPKPIKPRFSINVKNGGQKSAEKKRQKGVKKGRRKTRPKKAAKKVLKKAPDKIRTLKIPFWSLKSRFGALNSHAEKKNV